MPTFNDDDENPHFHSYRKLLMTIAPLIPTDTQSAEFKAMAVIWSRLVDKVPTYKRRVPGGHYAKRQADEAARIADEITRRGLLKLGNVGKRLTAEEAFDASLPETPADFDFAANARAFDESQARIAEEARARETERQNSIWERMRRGEV